ncbi:MAG: diacylglycerol kinase family protein [Streptosporangiaceae bacterium]|jgi:undecaprenyl-diphosphatase
MAAAAIIINRTRVRDLPRFRRQCCLAARAAGWEPTFAETTPGDHGLGAARDALAAGAGLVVAAGGDGTVRACAQALAGTGVPLVIVPRGTANLAARALGIPVRPDAALAAGFGGRDHPIDLAEADGMLFAAMAGIGLDAAVVSSTPDLLKRHLGWLAYAAGGVTRLAGRRRVFSLRLDGGPRLTRLARSVVVGNVGLLPGGFALLPDARLDDGLLDVGILAPAGPAGWGRVARRVLTGSRHDDQNLERYRARRIEIEADAELPREVDGEVITPGRSLTVTLRPAALLVRVPIR